MESTIPYLKSIGLVGELTESGHLITSVSPSGQAVLDIVAVGPTYLPDTRPNPGIGFQRLTYPGWPNLTLGELCAEHLESVCEAVEVSVRAFQRMEGAGDVQ